MNSCLRSTFTFPKACEVFLHHLRNSTGQKGTPLEYFRLCETFFWKKNHQRVLSPFNFLIFSDRMDVEKSQRPPFSVFFGIVRLFFKFFLNKMVLNSPILWHFEVILLFCSLRYGADLGRYRLVFLLGTDGLHIWAFFLFFEKLVVKIL